MPEVSTETIAVHSFQATPPVLLMPFCTFCYTVIDCVCERSFGRPKSGVTNLIFATCSFKASLFFAAQNSLPQHETALEVIARSSNVAPIVMCFPEWR